MKLETKLERIQRMDKQQKEMQQEFALAMNAEKYKNQIASMKEEADSMRLEIDKLEYALEDENTPESEKPDIRYKRDKMKARLNDFLKEIIILEQKVKDFPDEETEKNFDKSICLANIRELLKNSKVKLGQIEKASGNNPGYMSRLEKEGNTSDPSVEFLVTAADMLEVSLDMLVKGKIGDMTPSEEYLLKFINGLIADTRTEEIIWDKETVAHLDYLASQTGIKKHPLIDIQYDYSEDQPTQVGYGYVSHFNKYDSIEPKGNCYNAYLPGTSDKVYIMSCRKANSKIQWVKDEFFEMYLVVGSGLMLNPICTTLQTGSTINGAIESLYKEIEIAASHVRIDDLTKKSIDRYLNNRRG